MVPPEGPGRVCDGPTVAGEAQVARATVRERLAPAAMERVAPRVAVPRSDLRRRSRCGAARLRTGVPGPTPRLARSPRPGRGCRGLGRERPLMPRCLA